MSLFFYLLTFAISLWHQKFVTADVTARLSTINMVFSKDKILIKSLYLKGYAAKRLTDEFLEKSWTKRGVNKLLKTLRDTGTFDRRPDSGRPRSAALKKTFRHLVI